MLHFFKTAALLVAVQASNSQSRPSSGGSQPSATSPSPGNYETTNNQYTCQILSGTNGYRASNGKPALKGSRKLDAAALVICKAMIAAGKLDHFAGGTTPGKRIDAAGYQWNAVAENIYNENGYNPQVVAQRAVTGWINSPEHAKNMRGDYTSHGSAYCIAPDGTVYWAQDFGAGGDSPSDAYDCKNTQPGSSGDTNTQPAADNGQKTPSNSPPSSPSNSPPSSPPPSSPPSSSPLPNSPPPSYPANTPSKTGTPGGNNQYKPPTRYGPNGLPCKATSYGNKSYGSDSDLKKRAMNKSSRRK